MKRLLTWTCVFALCLAVPALADDADAFLFGDVPMTSAFDEAQPAPEPAAVPICLICCSESSSVCCTSERNQCDRDGQFIICDNRRLRCPSSAAADPGSDTLHFVSTCRDQCKFMYLDCLDSGRPYSECSAERSACLAAC